MHFFAPMVHFLTKMQAYVTGGIMSIVAKIPSLFQEQQAPMKMKNYNWPAETPFLYRRREKMKKPALKGPHLEGVFQAKILKNEGQ